MMNETTIAELVCDECAAGEDGAEPAPATPTDVLAGYRLHVTRYRLADGRAVEDAVGDLAAVNDGEVTWVCRYADLETGAAAHAAAGELTERPAGPASRWSEEDAERYARGYERLCRRVPSLGTTADAPESRSAECRAVLAAE